MSQPHVQVILGDEIIPDTLDAALRRIDATVSFRPINEALRPGAALTADAIVVVAPATEKRRPAQLKLLFNRIADLPRGTLVLQPAGTPSGQREPHPAALPVSYAQSADAGELAVRISTLLDMRRSLETLHRDAARSQHAEGRAAQRYDRQLRLASQVQREFLPDTLPRIGPASFSVVYKPAEFVSGDIYDVQRLDENHVGMALADATGKGIPAALLTVYIKRALRGKDIQGGHYRLLEPNEVLKRLNGEILEASLSECRFVAAAYAVLNIRTLMLTVARGGAPYPILRRADGQARMLRPAGGVIGVMPDAQFSVETVQLEPGDALLMYSDGMECMVVPQMLAHGMAGAFARAADIFAETRRLSDDAVTVGAGNGARRARRGTGPASDGASSVAVTSTPGGNGNARRSGLSALPDSTTSGAAAAGIRHAPDELIRETGWFDTLCRQGAAAALRDFDSRYEALRRIGHAMDDLTVLALQIDP